MTVKHSDCRDFPQVELEFVTKIESELQRFSSQSTAVIFRVSFHPFSLTLLI